MNSYTRCLYNNLLCLLIYFCIIVIASIAVLILNFFSVPGESSKALERVFRLEGWGVLYGVAVSLITLLLAYRMGKLLLDTDKDGLNRLSWPLLLLVCLIATAKPGLVLAFLSAPHILLMGALVDLRNKTAFMAAFFILLLLTCLVITLGQRKGVAVKRAGRRFSPD